MATSRKRICTRGNLKPRLQRQFFIPMEELRQMREKRTLQEQRQEELVALLRQRDEEFLQLRERITQLNPSYNRISRESGSNENMGNDVRDSANFGQLSYKLTLLIKNPIFIYL